MITRTRTTRTRTRNNATRSAAAIKPIAPRAEILQNILVNNEPAAALIKYTHRQKNNNSIFYALETTRRNTRGEKITEQTASAYSEKIKNLFNQKLTELRKSAKKEQRLERNYFFIL